MKRLALAPLAIAAVALLPSASMAHFQVLLPSNCIVGAESDKTLSFDILFTHPMEQGPAMEMGKPAQFGLLIDGQKHDLLGALKERKVDGKSAYTAAYTIKEPADHVFYIEPAPYWEPAEEKLIVHYTKVVVSALGAEEGWDAMVGFPVEIEPLTRPYGLWTGNVFQGIAMKRGKDGALAPVPFATVEVEYFNAGKKVEPPADAFVTQVVKADAKGVFTYAMPRAGWWGFAALIDGDEQLKSPDGKLVDVELGGLLWVECVDMR